MPRVTAIPFLLEHDRPTWEFQVDELVDVVMADGGDMAEFSALRTPIDLGVVSFGGESDAGDGEAISWEDRH